MLAPAPKDGDRDERTTTVRKTIAAATVTASLLGGGAVGALLLTPPLASAQDVTDETVEDDLVEEDRVGRFRTVLDDLVAAGTIDRTQADAVAEALAEARPDRGSHHRPGVHLDQVADAVGITVAELRTALEAGDTLAEVAEANGSSAEALVDALVADLDARLDERVAAGDLTQVEADARSAEAAERLTDVVQRELPERGFGRRHGGRGPGHRSGQPPVVDDDAEAEADDAA